MSWINFFFFVIILNTVTGTVAFFLCRLLARVAEYVGAIRIIYPMYLMVEFFYIVPIGFLYNRFRYYYYFSRVGVMGDFLWGNRTIRFVMAIAFLIWIFGIIKTVKYYIEKYGSFWWTKQKNFPFRDEHYMQILKSCYPRINWKKVRLCTNFLLKSPCVMGTFKHDLVLPEISYSKEDLTVILMHEATHIARHDNLWKKIGLGIVIINWFNPFIRWYLRDLDEWADTACDIVVCQRFLGNHSKYYFDVLVRTRTKGRSMVPPFVSELNKKDSLRRRVERMIKWKKNGRKLLISVLLTAVFVAGSSVTALAASSQVVDTQKDWYKNTREETSEDEQVVDSLEEFVIPADEVDEEKWANAIVYEEEGIDALTVQKNFDWIVPVGEFVRSTAFVKQKDTTIIVSCYVYSDSYHHVGIRVPDGSMRYVNGKGQVTHTFSCDKMGTYYVYVENMGSTNLHAAGYYIK